MVDLKLMEMDISFGVLTNILPKEQTQVMVSRVLFGWFVSFRIFLGIERLSKSTNSNSTTLPI